MNTTWANTSDTAAALGTTAERLRIYKREHWLKFGHHYRTTSSPNATKPRLQFNIENMKTLLNTPREKWKVYE